jgi:multicomponent Na+:H+ antiporter subunit D
VGFPGEEVLLWFGLYMVFYGIIYALLENDLRRILAYSIVNQVGFMIVGIGIGTPMALNGSASHAFTHIIYKALLLMSAGAVLHQTGKRKCTDLGGLFQSMPITTFCGIIGALAISSFPFTSGFVSKSMIGQAAVDGQLAFVWFMLGAASAGVFLHAGIKFPWFVFFQQDSGLRPPDPPWNMRWAMYLFAFLCIALGVYPAPLYAALPFPVAYVPYTAEHLVFQFQLLLFSGLAFFVMLPYMKRTTTVTLDLDWFYRRLFRVLARVLVLHGARARQALEDAATVRIGRLIDVLFRYYGPAGLFARTAPTGGAVIWVALLLAATLVVYYWQDAG